MPSESTLDFAPRKRLHRLSWIFASIEYLKHFLLPLLAAVFLGAQRDYSLWAALLVVPLIASALWHQWIYRYDFGPRGLVIREGLVFRNVRNIDYQRIENVDTERNLLHRLLKVAQVRVETSSGGGSEAVVRVLDMNAVQEMRERIFAARARQEATETGNAVPVREDLLLHLAPGELLRFGLIDNRGLIVVAAVFGLVTQIGSDRLLEAKVQPLLESLPIGGFATFGPLLQAFFIFSAIAGLIAGTRVLSVLLAFITLHDFRLTQMRDDLRVQHGLFTRISLTLRRPRIQAVHQKVSLLHRLFGRASLTVDLAGGLSGNAGQDGSRTPARELWLAPVCTPAEADRLFRIALPRVRLHEAAWQRLAPGARGRLFRLLSMLWLLFSVPGAAWLLGRWAPAVVLPVLPLLWLRRLSVTPRNRVQAVRLSTSPFDRRYGMASLVVDTAGARAVHLKIPYLDEDVATGLMRALHAA